jgi:hypothetical protein
MRQWEEISSAGPRATRARRLRASAGHIRVRDVSRSILPRRARRRGAVQGSLDEPRAHSVDRTPPLLLAHQYTQGVQVTLKHTCSTNAEKKWLRESEQRDKWRLRAPSQAEEGLARRSFRWSRNQRAVRGALIARHSRRGWRWLPCAMTRRWPSCARSSSCMPARSSSGSGSCLRAPRTSSQAAARPRHRWTR